MINMSKYGLLIIISSPSGGGKDAVIRALLKIFPHSARLVTTTTRPKRPREKNGVDYNFINLKQFQDKLKNNEFLEHNVYSNNYYGAEKAQLENLLLKNNIVFTNIDVNGKKSLETKPYRQLSIFLQPDDLENLKKRIIKRGGLNPMQITKRLQTAKQEMAAGADYDYQIINQEGHLTHTVKQTAKIITQEITNALDKKSHLR